MSVDVALPHTFINAPSYLNKILGGTKPGELPIQAPTTRAGVPWD
jgi:hypothetical protein